MKKLLAVILTLCMFMTACSVDQVLADINVLIQAASSIAVAVGPLSANDATAINLIASIASTGLSTIQADYDLYKKSNAATDLQKLQAAIAAVQTNLPQELAAAHIVDEHAQRTVRAWVGLTSATLMTVATLLPQFKNASKSQRMIMARQAMTEVSLAPETIKARWDKDVCEGVSPCRHMVEVHNHGMFTRVATLWIVR